MGANAEVLEHLIDEFGISNVLDTMAKVCHAKADHVQTNWQDRTLAVHWNRTAKTLESAAVKTFTSYGREIVRAAKRAC